MPSLKQQAPIITHRASLVADSVQAGETMGALRATNRLMDALQEFAASAVEQAAREGHSQQAIAKALGIPASTLKGLRQSVGAH
jgi:DNA-directed RNA polymerase specialized sigma24 family protein